MTILQNFGKNWNDPEVADAAAKIQASFRKRGGLKLKRKQKPVEKKVEDTPPGAYSAFIWLINQKVTLLLIKLILHDVQK